jgi:hypothetical protein
VSYRVQFEGQALVQLKGLPLAIFDALVERVTDLVRGALGRRSDEAWRRPCLPAGLFGHGYGLLSFQVDEAAEVIAIFDITWIG